jgi:hypothetical protein
MKQYWIAVREFFGVAQPEIIVVSSLIIGRDVISFDDVPKERYATRANRIRMVALRQFAERIPKTTVVFNRPRLGLAAPAECSFLSAHKKKTYCLYEAPNPEAIREAGRAGCRPLQGLYVFFSSAIFRAVIFSLELLGVHCGFRKFHFQRLEMLHNDL